MRRRNSPRRHRTIPTANDPRRPDPAPHWNESERDRRDRSHVTPAVICRRWSKRGQCRTASALEPLKPGRVRREDAPSFLFRRRPSKGITFSDGRAKPNPMGTASGFGSWTSCWPNSKLFSELGRLPVLPKERRRKRENGANPLQGRCCNRRGPGHDVRHCGPSLPGRLREGRSGPLGAVSQKTDLPSDSFDASVSSIRQSPVGPSVRASVAA